MKHNEDAELHYRNSNFYLLCKKEGRLNIKIFVFAYFSKIELQEGQTAVGLKYLLMKERG